jgi:hypothetical protein
MSRRPGPNQVIKNKDRSNSKFVSPHSPWQITIAEKMESLGLSTRKISKRLSERGFKLSHVLLWGWICHRLGYPPKAYTPELNSALAAILEMDAQELGRLYDQSRIPIAPVTHDRGLHALRRIVEESPRSHWQKSDLLMEIKQLMQ